MVLHPVLYPPHYESVVEVISSLHALSIQAVVAPAASVLVHCAVNPRQVALVPANWEQAAVEDRHPFPFVTHPDLNVLHKASVLFVIGASVQARGLHTEPVQKQGVVVVVLPDTRMALFPLQILVVKKSEQF